ncbi:phasin family protein [Actibacterium sp. XHP0104]|uniref:phasin family protein n=1 Tax=Actibacterium sp. XHP0104 TaxID=2984335 RepID=UPI0021E88302|nr:phasin family protein [Actibacterium sp. XHP0104]MCV2881482.1 phasin family protein [Actibacterium sp. XHP0104]
MADKGKPKLGDLNNIPGMKEAQDGMTMMGKVGKMMVDHMGRSGASFAEFINSRVKQDMELQQQIVKCKDVKELQRIQTEYLKTAMKQYTAETQKAMHDGAQVLEDLMKRAKG